MEEVANPWQVVQQWHLVNKQMTVLEWLQDMLKPGDDACGRDYIIRGKLNF
jgi:hypothetical protein